MDKKEKAKEVKVKIPQVKIIMLSSGQQVIGSLLIDEGSNFIRLYDPYKINLHMKEFSDDEYIHEEKMSLTPFVFQTVDKIYSVHKNHIVTIGQPNSNIKEYYNSVRLGLFPSTQKELKPIETKAKVEEKFDKMMETMSDEEYFDIVEYLRGKKSVN